MTRYIIAGNIFTFVTVHYVLYSKNPVSPDPATRLSLKRCLRVQSKGFRTNRDAPVEKHGEMRVIHDTVSHCIAGATKDVGLARGVTVRGVERAVGSQALQEHLADEWPGTFRL